ncbi:DUF6875 domain-containing protein [Nocardiopsis nanhaiensis]
MEPTASGRHESFHVADVHPNDHQEHAARDLAVLEDWLRESVGEPSPAIGRSGAVCPFTNPALKAGKMDFALRYDVDNGDPERIREITVEALHAFTARSQDKDQPSRATRLECQIVAFPGLASEHWTLIDKVHPELKDLAVDLGLMLGQFHPECDEGAVRNPLFPVARSPYPLFAIRFMAPHDILFLNGRRHWFQQYRERFPEEASGALRDGLMRELAERARARFGAPDPSGPEGEQP